MDLVGDVVVPHAELGQDEPLDDPAHRVTVRRHNVRDTLVAVTSSDYPKVSLAAVAYLSTMANLVTGIRYLTMHITLSNHLSGTRHRLQIRTTDPALPRAAFATIALATTMLSVSALAADIPVTTTSDSTDGGDDMTSLREAVAMANAAPGDDVLTLGPGDCTLENCSLGPLIISSPGKLTVQGGGGASIRQTCDVEKLWVLDVGGSRLALGGLWLLGGPNVAMVATGSIGSSAR